MNINDAQEIHRDIFFGMVAEELAKEGYYSESVTFYGFLESYRGGGDKSLKMRKHVQRPISKDTPWVHWCRRLPPLALQKDTRGTACAQRALCLKADLTSFWTYERSLDVAAMAQKAVALVDILTLPIAFSQEERPAIMALKRPVQKAQR